MRHMHKQYKKRWFLLIALAATLMMGSCRKSEFLVEASVLVVRDNGLGTGTTTFEKGKEYLLEGRVFVNDGQVLTIEPGAVIRFRRGKGAAASALIVARGGKIMAEGTAVNPIIFTAEGDDLKGSVSTEVFGLWGGLIILGNASINTPNGEAHIEGIPLSEPRGVFGGDNDEDNSGILRYVSIRHGGAELGKDNEINGLTLGGVGSNTIIENIEIISNADDGIEIFGGTVNLKNIVGTYCDDDGIDIDLGYKGNIQHVCIIQHEYWGDRIIEIDGAETIKTAMPYSLPVIYNLTAIGRGSGVTNHTLTFWDNAGGIVANSVFTDQHYGIEIEYSAPRLSSYDQWAAGKLQIRNCVFYNINDNKPESFFKVIPINDEDVSVMQKLLDNYFQQASNRFANPGFNTSATGISLVSEAAALRENIAPLPAGNKFLQETPYIGAFCTYNWVGEWTLTNQSGIVW